VSAMTPVYRPVVRAGDMCFISGQIGIGPDGMASGLAAQLTQIFSNLDALLTEHHLRRDQVVKATVFLTDMDDYTELNEHYREFFSDPYPARSAIQVAALPFGALIEIEAIAYDPISD